MDNEEPTEEEVWNYIDSLSDGDVRRKFFANIMQGFRNIDTIDKLEAERDRLRAVVEAVEWDAHNSCPWCHHKFRTAHAHDCPRQAALGATDDHA